MTVSVNTNKVQYNGSGTTGPFTVSFYFLEDSHLLVVKTDTSSVDTTLVLGTDYTVSGAGNPAGGSITLTTALASGEKLTITRNVPLTQETDYVENDSFPADTHERALDKLTMQNQQQDETLERAIKIPTSATGIDTDIALASIQPGYLLRWNSSANQIESVSATDAALSASLTPTLNDFIVGDGTDWANKTPTQVKTILSITTDDVSEGSNLYYTDARWDTRLGTKTTDDLSEGATNLYYTSARANTDFDTRLATKTTDDLSEGTTNKYYSTSLFNTDFSGKSTDDLSEGATNLYYTDARVDARINATSINALSDVDTTTTPPTSGQILQWNATTSKWEPGTAASGGEANTASNVGVGGVGVFKQKSGVDLEFKNINVGSSKLTVTDDTVNNEIDLDLGTVNLNDLSDVSGTPSTNDVLTYNGTGWAPSASGGGLSVIASGTAVNTNLLITGLSSYKTIKLMMFRVRNDANILAPIYLRNSSGGSLPIYGKALSFDGSSSITTTISKLAGSPSSLKYPIPGCWNQGDLAHEDNVVILELGHNPGSSYCGFTMHAGNFGDSHNSNNFIYWGYVKATTVDQIYIPNQEYYPGDFEDHTYEYIVLGGN